MNPAFLRFGFSNPGHIFLWGSETSKFCTCDKRRCVWCFESLCWGHSEDAGAGYFSKGPGQPWQINPFWTLMKIRWSTLCRECKNVAREGSNRFPQKNQRKNHDKSGHSRTFSNRSGYDRMLCLALVVTLATVCPFPVTCWQFSQLCGFMSGFYRALIKDRVYGICLSLRNPGRAAGCEMPSSLQRLPLQPGQGALGTAE